MPKGTVTMLFTDIEGSTRLVRQLGASYGEVLAEHRRILRASFDEFGGREMDTQGDAFFVAFDRARHALVAAVSAQRALTARSWPDGGECRVRMGIHTGEPEVGEEGYHGLAVHRGARICAAGHGGQILLSDATRQLVEDDLPPGVTLRDLGERRLKDLERPEHIYQLVVEGLPSQFPPVRTADAPSKPGAHRRAAAAVAAAILVVAAVVAILLLERGGSSPAGAAGPIAGNSVGVFRTADGRLTGQIDVGGPPSSIAAGFDSLWVANVDENSVSRINPSKGVVIQTIAVGNGPAGIAVGGGYVWVTNGLDGTVSKIDPKTDTVVDTIHGVGNGPAGVAVGGGTVWVASSNDDAVAGIGVNNDAVLGTIPVSGGADGIAVGLGSIWVTGQGTGTLTRIDARTHGVLAAIHAGGGAEAVATGAGAVWTANTLDDTVTEVDPSSNRIRAAVPVGNGPNAIAVGNGAVWVSNGLSGTLSQIDPLRATVVRTVKTGNAPSGLALEADQLFAAIRTAGAGHRGGTLRVAAAIGQFDSLDPAISYSPRSWQVLVLTNDGLTGFRRVGGPAGSRLVPDLATALPSPTDGGKTYSFQLRRGIRYSTGAPVRPEDFRRVVERGLLNSESPGTTYFAGIVGAQACLKSPKHCDLSRGVVTDDRANTVTFHLTAPDPDFLYELALPFAFAVPASTPLRAHEPVAATGPYEIASYSGGRLRLVRNPRFSQWSAAAQPGGYPNAITEQLTGTADAHVAAVARGRADLALDADIASPAVRRALTTQHASRVELSPTAGDFYFFLDTREKPFDDVRVRRALNYAVDRNKLLAAAGGPDLAVITCQILPPNFDAYRPYCPYTAGPSAAGTWTAPDLARAKALVAASGTKGMRVEVWAPHFQAKEGALLVATLASLGYRARLHTTAHLGPEMQAAAEGKVQAGASGWFADYAAPSGVFVPALGCREYTPGVPSSNPGGFCDPAIDREMARARALQTSSPQAASRLWAKIDHDVVDQAPWVPFVNNRAFEFLSDRVGNYQYNPQWGTLLDQLWVSSA
jgi:peptide/nickel transport system substrate-binding protein